MTGCHRSGQRSKGSANRKRGGHRRGAERRQPYRWLGASAVTIGMGLAMANGAGIAYAEEGSSEGSSPSGGSESSSGPSQTDSGNSGSTSTSSTSQTPSADTDNDPAADEDDPGRAESPGQEPGESPDAQVETIAAVVDDENDAEDDGVIDETAAMAEEAQPTSDSAAPPDADILGRDNSPTAKAPVDKRITRAVAPVDPSTTAQTEKLTATEQTHVAPEARTSDGLEDSFVPTTSADAAIRQVEATVSVTAVSPQQVQFRPIRSLVAWTLTVLGYNPSDPGASPNPFLELAWAVYRRTESFFFNQAPTVGTPQILGSTQGEDGSVVVTGTLDFSDFNGDQLTFRATDGESGTVEVQSNGTFTYTTNPGFTGSDSFTLIASDHGSFHLLSFLQRGGAHTTTATVSITIAPIGENNQPPLVGSPSYAVTAINRRTGAVSGTVNVTDPDGDTLTYSLSGPIDPEVGMVTVDTATGAWSFAPTATARLAAWVSPNGEALSFSIVADDGVASITVEVTAAINPAAQYTLESILGAEEESWGNQGLAIGPDGRFYLTTYVLDDTAGELVVLKADGTYAATVKMPTDVSHPYVTAYDVTVGPDGRVFVSGESAETADDILNESGRGFVAVIDPDDSYSVSVLAYTAEPASAIATDSTGRILLANWNNDSVTVLNTDGTIVSLIESAELVDGDDSGVAGIAVGPDGLLYLTKPSLGLVKIVDVDGATVRTVDLGGKPWAIAVAANGLAYVTDFDTAGVSVMNTTGELFRTIALEYGASPSDVTVGQDGRAYVSYLSSGGGAIAIVTAVPVDELEATVIGDLITGSPGSPDNPSGPVWADGIVYQATTGVDPTTGLPRTTVAVISGDGTTTLVHAPGEQVGSPVLGPDDVAYQTVSYFDSTSGVYRSGVLAVTPDGGGSFTGLFSGVPAGAVVFGGGNRVYQVLYSDGSADALSTTVLEMGPSGVAVHTINGYPGSLVYKKTSGPVVAPDGTVYLTITDFDGSDFMTSVATLNADGLALQAVPGLASGSVSIAPNGTVYQAIGAVGTDADSGENFATTSVAVMTDMGITVLPDTLVGLPLGSPVIAGENAIYQMLYDVNSADGSPGTFTLASVTATGLSIVIGDIHGTPTASDGAIIAPVVGADGSAYFTLAADPQRYSGSDKPTTLVVAISPTGEPRGVLSSGEPVGAVVLGADGVVYQTTYDPANDTAGVVVIAPGDWTLHQFDGYPGDPDSTSPSQVVTGADGTAYQVISSRDPVTNEYITTVVIVAADGVVATPSLTGKPSGAITFGADGRAFLTVGHFDMSTQTAYTTVTTIDAGGQSQVVDTVRGHPAGAVVFGPDGTAYQAVRMDDWYGATTAVHALNMTPIEFAAASRAQNIGALSVVSGHVYVIDDDYLAPFNAADPTGRFTYTSQINAWHGQVTDQTPLSAAQVDAWSAANASYLAHVGSAGFARDAQGRLIYRNTYAQDVLVVYGPNPNSFARGAVLARAGQTVTLPAGHEGAFAASQLAGQEDWDSVVYRGAAATPVSTPRPKAAPVIKVNQAQTEKMRAPDLIEGIPGSDQVAIEIVQRNGEKRMVVYVGGVIPSSGWSWLESVQIRSFGHIPGDVNNYINRYVDQYKPKEIMLVGHSKGGMIAQNYVAAGKYKSKVEVVVTFGTGIIKYVNNDYQAIHILDGSDPMAAGIHFYAQYLNNLMANRIYLTPPTSESDKHGAGNYKIAGQNFEWDSKWQGVKTAMRNFEGEMLHRGVLYYRI